MNIELQILTTILVLVWSLAMTRIISDLFFGRTERVEYKEIPKPILTEEQIVFMYHNKRDLFEEWLNQQPPALWISSGNGSETE